MKKLQKSIKHGMIFKLGDHILGCGDSREKEFVAKVDGKQKIKAIITDVPYGIEATESKRNFQKLKKDKVIENDHHQSDEEYVKFTEDWLMAITPHLEKKNQSRHDGKQ